MATEPSKQPTTGDSALSSLHDAWNVARNAMGIQPALESTNELLDAIRESVADRPEYIELEQNCVGIREVLSRRTSRNQDDHLSQSALGTIDELTMTTNEIKRHIAKQGKRRAISRVLRPKKRKDSIATWRLRLNQILCVLSAEFGSGEPITVSSPRHEIADPHTDTADAHCVTSGAETIALTAPHKNLGSCTAVPQVPTGFVNMHAAGHETRRDGAETGDGASNPGCSTHVSTPDESPRDAGETISDNCSHIEETRTTVEVQEVMPQRINEDVSDGYQVAGESVPGESPPPPPRIFGRDELVKEVVNLVDVNDPTPITLIGTGGIGKTSVALAALHHDRIKQRFGDHRRLLRCDQFAPSLPNFLRRLSEVIGAGIENPVDLAPLRPFLYRRKILLLIDNAEPLIGGPNAEDIISVVEELSRLGNIHLCITSRTSIIPNCKHVDVPTLSTEAACETFYHIYRRGEQSDAVDDILKQLDFHPLSITLLATAAKHNKWDTGQLEKKWEEQRTGILRTRFHGSLEATIEFSLRSPIFKDLGPHARELLGVVAFFPQGVDENNLDWLFPSIPDRKRIFGGFCVLSLTNRNKGTITMLAPLRDHLCPKDPMSASLLCSVKEHYFNRLSFAIMTSTPNNDRTTWIASEDVNVEHLLDIFTSMDANSERVWDACENFSKHLLFHKPRLPVFGPKIWALPDDHPSKPRCLFLLSNLCKVVGNFAEVRRLLCHTLKLYRERGDSHGIASTLLRLVAISRSPDLCEEGIQQAREAMTIFQRLGDAEGLVYCHAWLSSLFRCANRLDDAEKCESEAIALIDALMPIADSGTRGVLHMSLSVIHLGRGDGGTKKAAPHIEAISRFIPARGVQLPTLLGLAGICLDEGRFSDAEAYIEHAGSLAASGSSDMGSLTFLRARLLLGQGKFEEARSEALRALDLVEKFGGEDVKQVEGILDLIDRWRLASAYMVEIQGLVAFWTNRRKIRAALGSDISQDEEIHKALTGMTALLEKDGNRPGGPNSFQITKAFEEVVALIDRSGDKEVTETSTKSLAIPTAVDELEETPPRELLMRQGNRPVVIWTMDSKRAHVGQLWQALYHVPQVRHRISQYRSPHPPEGNAKVDVDPLSCEPGGNVLSAQELFGQMELSGLAVVTDGSLMERLPHRPWEGISPCEDVEKAYEEFSEQVEISLNDGLAAQNPDWPRLFHSRINNAASQGRSAFNARKDFPMISLGYDDGDGSNDLMGCLKNQVFPEFPEETPGKNRTTTEGCVAMEAADVIAFALERDESPPSTSAVGSQQRRKFSFPESFHLDQFVMVSRPHVQNANVAEGETLWGTGSEKTDIMGSILSSLHYYENVARSPADVERHAAIESSAVKLKNVVAHIDAEWNAIGTTVEQVKKESQNSSSSKQTQQNKYDLRAVLMHDAQKGRGHIYSYINHEDAWWKIVGYTVTKVALETVLSDENGMDVVAGPFFLIYSRSLSEPLKSEWPETLEKGYNSSSAPYGSNSLTPTEGP